MARKKKPSPPSGMLLSHGAGGSRDDRHLVALEDALDLPVRRFNFPYRKKTAGRRPPDRAPVLLQSIREEIDEWSDGGPAADRLILGGRSMGGRMCSMAVADGTPAAGLILLSYPLHPPRKPEKLRVDHFPELTVPCLFVMGTRDPFGTPAEFEEHLAAIPGPVTTVWLEGANHSPTQKHDAALVSAVQDWVDQLV